jgi:hypothetical protein
MSSTPNDYLDYLNQDGVFEENFLSDLKYEIDSKLYQYGNHFIANNENKLFLYKQRLVYIYRALRGLMHIFFGNKKLQNIVISSAYFTVHTELNKNGYHCFNVPWLEPNLNFKLYLKLQKFNYRIKNCKFSEINSLYEDYLMIRDSLKKIYSNPEIKFLILPQDVGAFERISIRIFKELNKKTFLFSHGLPGRYNCIDDNRTDILAVWGKTIKENYVKAGISAEKIKITGHPLYHFDPTKIKLKSSLDNILVLSKSINGTPHSTGVRISDRTNLLLYLFQIKKELLKVGIKSVKFRPHPSENPKWYYNYIDADFFIMDTNKSIINSFQEASIVIGPTSSMFIDAIVNNVNYLVYEPSNGEYDMHNFPLVSPFDSSDDRVVVAKDSADLGKNLQNIPLVEPSILLDYIEPNFDISFLKQY